MTLGWFNSDAPGHEGYVVALERVDGTFREIGDDRTLCTRFRGGGIDAIQVACDCGWRSRRFVPPFGAEYWPHIVELHDDRAEELCAELWRIHATEDAIRAGWPLRSDALYPLK